MTPNERREMATEIYKLATNYSRDVKPEAMDLYWEILQDVPLDRLRRATDECLRDPEQRYMPKAAELLARCGSTRQSSGYCGHSGCRNTGAIAGGVINGPKIWYCRDHWRLHA